jgi:hypothetical protein
MNKIVIIMFFSFLTNLSVCGQDTIKIGLLKEIKATVNSTIRLYKFNKDKQCDQSKAVTIIYENKVSKCFDYIKTIKTDDTKKIVSLLKTPTTYGGEDVACFDTDYALLIFNKQNVIIGYIDISLFCNKLISAPVIAEQEHYSKGGLRKVGFSKKGKAALLKLLKITDNKK